MTPAPCPVCDGGESSALAVALHNETAARTGCRVYRVRRAVAVTTPYAATGLDVRDWRVVIRQGTIEDQSATSAQRPAAWLAEHFPLPERMR